MIDDSSLITAHLFNLGLLSRLDWLELSLTYKLMYPFLKLLLWDLWNSSDFSISFNSYDLLYSLWIYSVSSELVILYLLSIDESKSLKSKSKSSMSLISIFIVFYPWRYLFLLLILGAYNNEFLIAA